MSYEIISHDYYQKIRICKIKTESTKDRQKIGPKAKKPGKNSGN